jgi:hypothetical protein
MAIGTTTAALLGAGASLAGGALSASGARSSASAQRQAAEQQAASQERIAREQMQLTNQLYGEQQAQMYPRQQASNRALSQISGMLGLGDIYGAPQEGSLGGGAQFYPRAPFNPDGTPAVGGGNGMYGAQPSQLASVEEWAAYADMHPDVKAYYESMAGQPGGYAFGPNLPATYDLNNNQRIDLGELSKFHYDRSGRAENRELPEGLFF